MPREYTYAYSPPHSHSHSHTSHYHGDKHQPRTNTKPRRHSSPPPRPSKPAPSSTPEGFEPMKSFGLKAAVLAMMAGLALYPKISAEAEIAERASAHRRAKQGRDGFRKREKERNRHGDDHSSRGGGNRSGNDSDRWRDDDSTGRYTTGRRSVDFYDRKGRYTGGSEKYAGERRERRSVDDRRTRGEDAGRWEAGSVASDRTRDWVDGGYGYLNDDEYRERDRRRW